MKLVRQQDINITWAGFDTTRSLHYIYRLILLYLYNLIKLIEIQVLQSNDTYSCNDTRAPTDASFVLLLQVKPSVKYFYLCHSISTQ